MRAGSEHIGYAPRWPYERQLLRAAIARPSGHQRARTDLRAVPGAWDGCALQFDGVAPTQLKVGVDDPIWREDTLGEPVPAQPRRGRLLVIGLLIVLTGVTCYCIAAAALSRQDYGTFAFWRSPRRIDYCGRRYYSQGTATGNPVTFTSGIDPSAEPHWQTVGHTFSLRPIQAPVLGRRGPSSVCAMAVYVPVGGGRFSSYGLSGSP
jgi:hypothetical protein